MSARQTSALAHCCRIHSASPLEARRTVRPSKSETRRACLKDVLALLGEDPPHARSASGLNGRLLLRTSEAPASTTSPECFRTSVHSELLQIKAFRAIYIRKLNPATVVSDRIAQKFEENIECHENGEYQFRQKNRASIDVVQVDSALRGLCVGTNRARTQR